MAADGVSLGMLTKQDPSQLQMGQTNWSPPRPRNLAKKRYIQMKAGSTGLVSASRRRVEGPAPLTVDLKAHRFGTCSACTSRAAQLDPHLGHFSLVLIKLLDWHGRKVGRSHFRATAPSGDSQLSQMASGDTGRHLLNSKGFPGQGAEIRFPSPSQRLLYGLLPAAASALDAVCIRLRGRVP